MCALSVVSGRLRAIRRNWFAVMFLVRTRSKETQLRTRLHVTRASVVCETGEHSLTVRVVLRYWPSTMEKKRRLALASVALAVLAILALLALSTGRPSARLPLPNPNGYDDFIKAGDAIVGDVANSSALDHDGLRESVSTNAEALHLLRLGSTLQCAIPPDSVMTNAGGMLNDLASFKRLALLLAAE